MDAWPDPPQSIESGQFPSLALAPSRHVLTTDSLVSAGAMIRGMNQLVDKSPDSFTWAQLPDVGDDHQSTMAV